MLAAETVSASHLITIDIGWLVGIVLGALLVQAIIAVMTGLITAGRVLAVMKVEIEAIQRTVGKLDSEGQRRETLIVQAREDRLACALEAAKTYSHRSEVSRLVNDTSQQYHTLADKIDALGDKLHDRVTKVTRDVEALKGRMETAQ